MHRFHGRNSPIMAIQLKDSLTSSLQPAATHAGLSVLSATAGSDFNGQPTAVFQLGLPGVDGRTLQLELSEAFEFNKPDLVPQMTAHLAAQARRLRNPRPECYVTLAGLPIAFGKFQWPFHRSTSGADTYIVGEMHFAVDDIGVGSGGRAMKGPLKFAEGDGQTGEGDVALGARIAQPPS